VKRIRRKIRRLRRKIHKELETNFVGAYHHDSCLKFRMGGAPPQGSICSENGRFSLGNY